MRDVRVDFGKTLRGWDGFGVNYVETAQTRDYGADPQEYGGFSLLSEADRQEILDLVFGSDGLKPGVVKMFLDPFHQDPPGPDYDYDPFVIDASAYDHESTTRWMLRFVNGGYLRTRSWDGELQIILTLYGPPAWMTRQKFVRGRDLDEAYKAECAKYLVAWAKHLREQESLPVRFLSLHNEGEDWERWPLDGGAAGAPNHDYNMYWPPEQVVEFLKLMPELLAAQGMSDVGVAPGETTNWYRFSEWGYADAIADDVQAIQSLGLITSHGFKGASDPGRWYGDWRSRGTDLLRARRPELHSWATSTSWSDMDVFFLDEMRHNIYSAKVNAIIPWACIQRPGMWVGGDPNPGCAFKVFDDGTFQIEPGYYYYKQLCRAGQPGMAVARVRSNDSEVGLIAFASNGTQNPDTFLVLNLGDGEKALQIGVWGSTSRSFEAYRTLAGERYRTLGVFALRDGVIPYEAPPRSVTTFYGG